MKIEIKNVKYSEFASQETNCFQATVYIDGVKSFIASNEGHGGCDNYSPVNSDDYTALRRKVKKIDEELNKEKIKTEWGEINNCLEIAVGDLLEDFLLKKDLRKVLKKVILLQEGKIFITKLDSSVYKAYLSDYQTAFSHKYPNALVLNSLSLNDAFKHYKSAMKGA